MKITIIGTGYVGLVSGACFAEFGVNVVCIDKDLKKIENLKKGILPIYEPGLDTLVKKNVDEKRLSFENNLDKALAESSAIFIAVGTPSRRGDGHADLTYVYQVAKEIGSKLKHYAVIVNKSTVPIGTGKKVFEIIKKINPNLNFDVVSNPEFLREGSAINDFMRPDRVVIGCEGDRAKAILKELYRPLYLLETPILFTKRETAELIKYAANSFLATKITFINEIANLCESAGINVEDVSVGIGSDARIGSRFLRAGPAYGGSCFPKDTKGLVSIADKFKTNLSIVKSVIKSNQKRKFLLTKRVIKILNNKIKNKRITVLGATFKANTDDMRQSSSLTLIPFLLKKGALVRYYDPSGLKKEFKKHKNLKFKNTLPKACVGADLIIINTEWDEFKSVDFKKMVKKNNFKVYDMRNLYNPEEMKRKNIKYYSIGR